MPGWTSSRANPSNTATVELEAAQSRVEGSWTFAGSERVWGFTPGMSVWSSPAVGVVGDRAVVVIGSYDHNLYCLEAGSGELLWSLTTGDGVYAAPILFDAGGTCTVIATSSDRLVYALEASQGRRLWVHEVEPYRPTLGGARLSSPCLGEVRGTRAVFVGHWAWDRSLARSLQRGALSALDAERGTLLWQAELGDNEVSDPAFFVVDAHAMVFVGTANGNLFALDAASGEVVWKRTELDAIRAAPAVVESRRGVEVVYGSKYGLVRSVDAISGDEHWSYKTGERVTAAPLVATLDGRQVVLVGSLDRQLHAIDLESGKALWRAPTRGGVFASAALLPAEGRRPATVAVTAWDHQLHGVAADDGRPLWTAFTGRPLWTALGLGDSTWSSPAAARINGRWMIYVGSYNGVLYGLDLRQLEDEDSKKPESNRMFWISLPLVIAAMSGLAMTLTWRDRRRRRRARV